jgi:hypothetical protein
MEAKDIVNILRTEKGLSEAEANERAHAMLATVKGKHPRLEITAVVIEGALTIVCLANGTQVKFDPSLPVPVWKYPAEKTGSLSGARMLSKSKRDERMRRDFELFDIQEEKYRLRQMAQNGINSDDL